MIRNLTVVLVLLLTQRGARADITPIGPFTGDRSDPLNYPTSRIVADLPIFGDAAHLQSHDGVTTYIHLIGGSTLSGDPVTPRTGGLILGFTQGPGVFLFDPPVRQFGAFFNNNSGTNDAMLSFFDAGGSPLGTQVATTPAPGNVWIWNGWQSDAPVSRIVVTGNGILDGFLWFDDLELSYVPEPATCISAAMFAILAMRRMRR